MDHSPAQKLQALPQSLDVNQPDMPIWFGSAKQPLFGWYTPGDRAQVVICPPFGHEALVIYRAMRHLAVKLSGLGCGVLRFDYLGTGQSYGPSVDKDTFACWTQNIIQAVSEVTTRRSMSGDGEVLLLGVRLGALLAAQAALELKSKGLSINGLVMIAPVISGRAYVRELSALQSLGTGGLRQEAEVTGYPFNEAMKAELAQLDLTKMPTRLASRLLILQRDDLPAREQALKQEQEKYACDVTLAVTESFASWMPDDAYKAKIPHEMWNQVAAWVDRGTPAAFPPGGFLREASLHKHLGDKKPSTKFFLGKPVLVDQGVHERCGWIAGHFVVLSEPADKKRSFPLVLIPNTGANPMVSPHRLSVKFARQLAGHGCSVMRFDRSGLGETPAKSADGENQVYTPRGVPEINELIAALVAHQSDFDSAVVKKIEDTPKFVVIGLCSGAYYAYHTALENPAVVGTVLLNPVTFHWHDGDSLEIKSRKSMRSANFYSRAIRSRQSWRKLFKGQVHLLKISQVLIRSMTSKAKFILLSFADSVGFASATTDPVARGFRTLLERGVQVRVYFDADDGGLDLIQAHLGPNAQLCKEHPNFKMRVITGADHTFTPLWSQDLLAKELITFMADSFY